MIDTIVSILQSSQLPQYLQLVVIVLLVWIGKGKGKDAIKEGAKTLLVDALQESLAPMLKKAVKEGVREGLNPFMNQKKYNGETQTQLEEVKK